MDFEWGKWCLHLFSVTMNSVFINFIGQEDRHKISDEFESRSSLTCHFIVPLNGEKKNKKKKKKRKKKRCLQLFSVTFEYIFIKLAGNGDRHKRSNKIEFGPDQIVHFGVIFLERGFFSPQIYNGENDVPTFTLNSVFIKLTGNKDRHEMLDGFKFRPDLTSHFGVTCP